MLSTASSGVSVYPFRNIALYICWGEGYSQFCEGVSPRGMEDVSRVVGRGRVCVAERDWERVVGM